MGDFVHLHVHTQYSLLDGMNRSGELLERVKSLGMDSVAITDHGVLYGVPEFWTAAKDMGVKPIIGCEAYLAPGKRDDRREINGIKYYHLLLIAKNKAGYQNLVKLVTKSHLEGMYYKPRVDLELLKQYHEGIICTSACLAGPLSRHIVRDEIDKATWWLEQLHGIFGSDFYLELQRNGLRCEDEIEQEKLDGLPQIEMQDQLDMLQQQTKVNQKLYDFSEQYKIPLIASTDAHYLKAEDKAVQKILFCIRDGRQIDDPNGLNGYLDTYIKSPEELYTIFSDIPEVLEETVKIGEQIEAFDITFDRVQPKFWNLPEHITAKDELRLEVFRGAYRKYPHERKDTLTDSETASINELEAALQPDLVERLDYELQVIHDKGYDDYFLVVSDILKWALKQNILTGVRGSVAGSVAAYCLDIVGIDPIKWELYFERFLNPERPSPPDIDMDIQDSRRDELMTYVREKYGNEAVAAICAIGRLKTKAAIRDVARVMGIDLSVADKLSKKVIVLFGKPFTFNKMMEEDPEFAAMVHADTKLQELGRIVTKIEGLARHMSVHACGYLITPGPIENYTALQYETGGDRVITQWEGPWIEELGLMKFDFLGLRTLTIVSDAISYIKNRTGKDIDFWTIPDDDEETFKLFGRGETIGVFQFESPPMQRYLIDLQPETQEDLCFMAAAYRPGPMKYIPDYISIKHGHKEPEILIPELEDIVGMTNGFAIYQEQVIKIAVELGGYTMGGADLLRRAMGKKKMKIMKQEEPKFKQGIKDKGYSQEIADTLWEYLLPFADYGFNKAHAAGYAVLAYRSAYLKAHYPLEFMTALFHADLENPDRIVIDMQEAKRLGFKVLPPDINTSDVYFQPEGEDGIRFGLGAIKNVGFNVCECIVSERQKNGPFAHFDDFVQRVGTANINKRAAECLIKVGALDSFGDRHALLKIVPQVFDKAQADEKAAAIGQTGLFSMVNEAADDSVEQTPFPAYDPATDREKIAWESELIGMYISTHPLEKFQWARLLPKMVSTRDLDDIEHQRTVRLVGTFRTVKELRTKANNDRMAVVTIEDTDGTYDGVIFPKTFADLDAKELVVEGRAYVISGRINERDDRRSVVIESLEPAASLIPPKEIQIDIRKVHDAGQLQQLKQAFSTNIDDAEPHVVSDVLVTYGSKQEKKHMKRSTRLDLEQNIEILKQFIVR